MMIFNLLITLAVLQQAVIACPFAGKVDNVGSLRSSIPNGKWCNGDVICNLLFLSFFLLCDRREPSQPSISSRKSKSQYQDRIATNVR